MEEPKVRIAYRYDLENIGNIFLKIVKHNMTVKGLLVIAVHKIS